MTSPTFVIAREHPPLPDALGGRGVVLVHVDAYRLGVGTSGDPDPRDVAAQLDDLDLDTDLTRAAVVIEWGEGVAEHLAAEHLTVRLDRTGTPDAPEAAGRRARGPRPPRRWRGPRLVGSRACSSWPSTPPPPASPRASSSWSPTDPPSPSPPATASAPAPTPSSSPPPSATRWPRPDAPAATSTPSSPALGPGPFTGLRVGLVTAAAMGDALGIPVYGVGTHDAMAAGLPGRVLVVTDARRREVYWSLVVDGVRTHGPEVVAPAVLAERLATDLGPVDRVVGDAAHQLGAEDALPGPTPAGLVAVAARRPARRDDARPAGAALPAPPRRGPARRAEDRHARMTSTDVVVDALTPDDADRCAQLEAVLFPGDDPWSARAFRDELRAGHVYLAARSAGELVGYGGIALLPARLGQHAEAEIHTIGVDPGHQGRASGARCSTACSRPPTGSVRPRTWRCAPTTRPRSTSTASPGSRSSAPAAVTTPRGRTRTR